MREPDGILNIALYKLLLNHQDEVNGAQLGIVTVMRDELHYVSTMFGQ